MGGASAPSFRCAPSRGLSLSRSDSCDPGRISSPGGFARTPGVTASDVAGASAQLAGTDLVLRPLLRRSAGPSGRAEALGAPSPGVAEDTLSARGTGCWPGGGATRGPGRCA